MGFLPQFFIIAGTSKGVESKLFWKFRFAVFSWMCNYLKYVFICSYQTVFFLEAKDSVIFIFGGLATTFIKWKYLFVRCGVHWSLRARKYIASLHNVCGHTKWLLLLFLESFTKRSIHSFLNTRTKAEMAKTMQTLTHPFGINLLLDYKFSNNLYFGDVWEHADKVGGGEKLIAEN